MVIFHSYYLLLSNLDAPNSANLMHSSNRSLSVICPPSNIRQHPAAPGGDVFCSMQRAPGSKRAQPSSGRPAAVTNCKSDGCNRLSCESAFRLGRMFAWSRPLFAIRSSVLLPTSHCILPAEGGFRMGPPIGTEETTMADGI